MSTIFMQDNVQYSKVNYADSQYPVLLKEIQRPPRQLYVRGSIRPDIPLVGVVGTRKITSYGQQVVRKIVTELADAGLGIVSGLAYGIDAAAHTAALQVHGYTIAVLGNAIDHIYPVGNEKIGEEIITAGGALISQYAPGLPTQRHFFPERNRIIAGLCQGILVIEADAKSGALITAHEAREANREVMAVPGNITSSSAQGTNNLIHAGAAIIRNASDVLFALGLTSQPTNESLQRALPEAASHLEANLLQMINQGITSSEELIQRAGIDPAEFARTMSIMEITGKIKPLEAGYWVIAD